MIEALETKGYFKVEKVYSPLEIENIKKILIDLELEKKFGIREFLVNYPQLVDLLITEKFRNVIKELLPSPVLMIKSIYFDKPPNANWLVNWHQDLTINLKNTEGVFGLENMRTVKDRVVYRPPIDILRSIVTARIHLDDCDSENGALRVIDGSHNEGVINIDDWLKVRKEKESICDVASGGIFFMKPLLLHSSKRTEDKRSRRVIHIEFCNKELPSELHWKEGVAI